MCPVSANSPPALRLLANLGLAEAVPILLDLIRSYHRQTANADPRLLETARSNCRKAIFLLYRIARLDDPSTPTRSAPRQPRETDPSHTEHPVDPLPIPTLPTPHSPSPLARANEPSPPPRADAPLPPSHPADNAPLIPLQSPRSGAHTLLIAAGSTRPRTTPHAQASSPTRAGRESPESRARPPPR